MPLLISETQVAGGHGPGPPLPTGCTPRLPQTGPEDVHVLSDLGGGFFSEAPARAQPADTSIPASETLLAATAKASRIPMEL